jgi:antitoxin component YwqK of YwqJK toxin-antitoxin module
VNQSNKYKTDYEINSYCYTKIEHAYNLYQIYHNNEQISEEGIIIDGKKCGLWSWWYIDGTLWSECDYDDGGEYDINRMYHWSHTSYFTGKL